MAEATGEAKADAWDAGMYANHGKFNSHVAGPILSLLSAQAGVNSQF
jgi:hypothetical protein